MTDGLEEAALRLPAHGALGLFDEAFGHIAADIARLTGGQIAVIALLEVDAQLAGDFVFHLVQRALGLRHDGAAAAAAFAGETGRMIALKRISAYPYQCITESVDVQQVANLEKKVPLDWISPDGMQVTAAFEEYARPLILDEVTPVYVNGTPRHIRL